MEHVKYITEAIPDNFCNFCNKPCHGGSTLSITIRHHKHNITGFFTRYTKVIQVNRCYNCKRIDEEAKRFSVLHYLTTFFNQFFIVKLIIGVLFLVPMVYFYLIKETSLICSLAISVLIYASVFGFGVVLLSMLDTMIFRDKRIRYCQERGTMSEEDFTLANSPKDEYFKL